MAAAAVRPTTSRDIYALSVSQYDTMVQTMIDRGQLTLEEDNETFKNVKGIQLIVTLSFRRSIATISPSALSFMDMQALISAPLKEETVNIDQELPPPVTKELIHAVVLSAMEPLERYFNPECRAKSEGCSSSVAMITTQLTIHTTTGDYSLSDSTLLESRDFGSGSF